MTRRIAILLTNDDTAAFAQSYPNDGEKFAARLQALRPNWVYAVVPVKDGVFPANLADPTAFDGYLITGSPASVNADLPWVARLLALLRALHAARRPLVGLCFGHQALAKALGGHVGDNPGGWGLGVATTTVTEFKPWMQPTRARLHLLAAHREQVLQAPPGARVLGGSAFCPVGAMALGDHAFSSQYHPEMSPAFMGDLLAYLDGKLPPVVLAQARADLAALTKAALREPGAPLDDDLLFGWIVHFLETHPTKALP